MDAESGGSAELSADSHRFLRTLTERSRRVDGQPPFSDQSLVDLVSGRRRLITAEIDGRLAAAAILTVDTGAVDSGTVDSAPATSAPANSAPATSAPAEAELVVDPDARHRGLGAQLVRELMDAASGRLLIWAHGDHPDARALAARFGLAPVRELLQLRAAVPAVTRRAAPSTGTVSAFRPGIDDADWLALNARSFADHPEQGALQQADLDARIADGWFDPGDFLIARDGSGTMIGFCWLKVDGGESSGEMGETIGEFYAVGVDPAHQGEGLGRRLVNAGLSRLAERGIRVASLYVEGDNVRAVALYRSVGFDSHSIDIQYASAAQ
jgi:mycothiol synthase